MLRRLSCGALAALFLLASGPSEVLAAEPLKALRAYLDLAVDKRPPLAKQAFAEVGLSKQAAAEALALLRADQVRQLKSERAAEMKARMLKHGDRALKFAYRVLGKQPPGGRSLFISMHGGGGTAKRVNDGQWNNQKNLYSPAEGVYVAPRAPTDSWNMWHQGHVDPLFDRLIENMILFENVNPDRVYLMGYSAGGDGVYQLAPRMADRFAAAAMMAGHPNESQPLGLRNLPFTLHVGGNDRAYNRNGVAKVWAERLVSLRQADPQGYVHWAKIYPGKGHWLNREDAAALPWMAKHTRNAWPDRIVWRQDDVTHSRFYWLAIEASDRKRGATVIAQRKGNAIDIERADVPRLRIRLHDRLLDLDKPLTVRRDKKVLFQGTVKRTVAAIHRSLTERADPASACLAEVQVEL